MTSLPTYCAPGAYTPAHPIVPPSGNWEYALAVVGLAILAASFVWGARLTLNNRAEEAADHIKRRILIDPAWEVPHD